MKNTIKQIFHSGKFVTGFVIFLAILLTIIIYPLVVAKDPLAIIGTEKKNDKKNRFLC